MAAEEEALEKAEEEELEAEEAKEEEDIIRQGSTRRHRVQTTRFLIHSDDR